MSYNFRVTLSDRLNKVEDSPPASSQSHVLKLRNKTQ